jgi:hypothetical protein
MKKAMLAEFDKEEAEWRETAEQQVYASALATRLMSEDELRAAGVNPDVKH